MANNILEDIYKVNGGEYVYEIKNGCLFGTASLIIGACLAFYIYYVLKYGGTLISPIYVTIGAVIFTGIGLLLIIIGTLIHVKKIRSNLKNNNDL